MEFGMLRMWEAPTEPGFDYRSKESKVQNGNYKIKLSLNLAQILHTNVEGTHKTGKPKNKESAKNVSHVKKLTETR